MTKNSMLAAVRAAAQVDESISPADDAAAQPQPQEEDSMAETKKGPAALTAEQREAFKAEIQAEVQSEHDAALTKAREDGKVEGAEAERERILGIDANAMPGHEELIAKCKADPNVTPDKAAGQILAAEKTLRENHAAGIQAVEENTGDVQVAASANEPRQDSAAGQNTPQGWAAQYNAQTPEGEKIRKEFPTEGSYIAYMKSIQPGFENVVNFGPVEQQSA